MADTYAIVESGGKQYRAEKGARLLVERVPADEGSKVNLRAVMFKDDGNVVLEGHALEKVKVEAVVAEHVRGPKVRIFKYKPKKGYRRRAGHRQALTRLEVTEVKMLTRKPSGAAAKQAEKKAEPKAKAEAKPKPPAKKAPAKKAAPKKPAAKKPAAKKPATKRSTSKSKSSSGGRSSSSRRSSSAKKES